MPKKKKRAIHRDGKTGEFARPTDDGAERELIPISNPVIDSIDDLVEYEDYEEYEHEFHGTGDTGGEQ